MGREVSVAELLKEAWKGIVVSRRTIAVTISEASKALGEHGSWIEYPPNRGYRLKVPVTDEQLRIGLLMMQRCIREGIEKAFAELRRAREENSASLYAVDVDPKLDSLRTDPRFRSFRRGLFRS